ncbi:hypothetical protein FACS189454_07790 [Planctomycetales bacterium]|nr:hypothetical protein FACS189454_07790 [Planctomycetales bacterium]
MQKTSYKTTSNGNYSDRNTTELLKEAGCFTLSHVTVGSKATEIADEIDTALQNNNEIRKVSQEAKGDTEFTMDGAFINIRNEGNTHCWQEMKVAVFSKRERGASAMPEDWCNRNLPKPTVNMAIATLGKIEEFTERCNVFRFNLGVGGNVSVPGDGAHRIWDLSLKLFGNTAECLDIFHVPEYLDDCGKALFKDEAVCKAWFEDTRMLLLRKGFSGVNGLLSGLLSNDIFTSSFITIFCPF